MINTYDLQVITVKKFEYCLSCLFIRESEGIWFAHEAQMDVPIRGFVHAFEIGADVFGFYCPHGL